MTRYTADELIAGRLGFWGVLFGRLHKSQRIESDPEKFENIQIAIRSLRKFAYPRSEDFDTKSRENLAARIGIMPHTLKLLEMRGGIIPPTQCYRLRNIALEYQLPKLAEFFDLEGLRNAKRGRKRRSSEEVEMGNDYQG